MMDKRVKELPTKEKMLEEIEELLLKNIKKLEHSHKEEIKKRNEKAQTLTKKEIEQVLSNLEEKYVSVTSLCVECDHLISYTACKAYPHGIPDDIFYGKDRCLKNKLI
jgi:hypothetical protein